MPTISEPEWPEDDERIKAIIDDYVHGGDSESVLRARLFGKKLRGQDLDLLVNQAMNAKIATKGKQFIARKVLVLYRNRTSRTLTFVSNNYAITAVTLLKRQPDVLFACVVEH